MVIALVALIFSGSFIIRNVKETKANKYIISLKEIDSKAMLEELKVKGFTVPECYPDEEELKLHLGILLDLWCQVGITDKLPFNYDGYDKLAKEMIRIIY